MAFVLYDDIQDDPVSSESPQGRFQLMDEPENGIQDSSFLGNLKKTFRPFNVATMEAGADVADTMARLVGYTPPDERPWYMGRPMGEEAPYEESTPYELVHDLYQGEFVPESEQERKAALPLKAAANFAALGPAFGAEATAAKILKEFGKGGLFGVGELVGEEAVGGPAAGFVGGLAALYGKKSLATGKNALKNIVEFGRGLMRSPQEADTPAFLQQMKTPEALADLELSQKDLTGRVAKTSKTMLGEFDQMMKERPPSSLSEAGFEIGRDIKSEVESVNRNFLLNEIAPNPGTQAEAWNRIQDYSRKNFEAAKKSYRRLYEEAEVLGKEVRAPLPNTFKEARELQKEIRGSLVNLSEVDSVKNVTNQLAKKTGYTLEELAARLQEDLSAEGIVADINEVLDTLKAMGEKGELAKIPIDRAMKTKRAIGRLLRKEQILPAPVDLLKRFRTSLKKDIINALDGNPAKDIYQEAENIYGETHSVYGSDVMKRFLGAEAPQKMASAFAEPNAMELMNKNLGGNREYKRFLDRLVIEPAMNAGKDNLRNLLNELKPQLSDEAKQVGSNLQSYSNAEVTRGKVLQDIQNSMETGALPKYTLDVMSYPEGYRLVRDSLIRSPNGQALWQSLNSTLLEGIMEAIKTDGAIDFEKASEIFNNPFYKRIVKDQLGESGFNLLKSIERRGQNMASNIRELVSTDPTIVQRVGRSLANEWVRKGMVAASFFTGGKALLGVVAPELLQRARDMKLSRVLKNAKAQRQIGKLGVASTPAKTKEALRDLGKIINEIQEEGEG